MFTKQACALCDYSLELSLHQIHEEDLLFCCRGCQLVYSILHAQNALTDYSKHPLFQKALEAGLITNPQFHLSKNQEKEGVEWLKFHLVINDMWCPSCAQVIHLILLKEKGIKTCLVDYSTDLAVIEFDPKVISKDKILRLIKQLGYVPSLLQDPRQEAISLTLKLRFIVAAFFSLNVMMFAYPIYATYWDGDPDGYAYLFAWLSLGGSIPVLTYSAWPIWKRFYTGLRVGVWGMEALVFLGVVTATGLSLYELFQGRSDVYFDSMTVIILFVLLGKLIESRAKFSAKDALVKLSLAVPRKGRKQFTDGSERFVPLKDVQKGDVLVVYLGEKIALDGVVEKGEGVCDESVMTGESKWISKIHGSTVLAGSILQQGQLTFRVTSNLEETVLHKIMDMVGQEIQHKSRYTRLIDKIVQGFVPFVLSLALLTGLYCLLFNVQDKGQSSTQTAIIRMVSVLLISCPCAIGIAVPLVESYLLNRLAKIGVIVRNRGCLTFFGRETLWAFDKTGTLTQGHFEISQGLETLTEDQQRILKTLTAKSIHPIACAINQSLQNQTFLPLDKIEEKIGKGMKGWLNEDVYLIGSASFLREENCHVTSEEPILNQNLFTSVYFSQNGKVLTTLLLGDQLKPGIQNFIHSLTDVKIALISGDSQQVVSKVAEMCHISHWFAERQPLEKKDLLDQFKSQGEIIVMVGDGINDAPALTAAHVGIAVMSASDISIQVADLLLSSNQFDSLSFMQKIARKAQKIIRQNLFWAFFYNCIGLLLAITGQLTPLFAAFAMVISSLIVLGNARRLASMQQNKKQR